LVVRRDDILFFFFGIYPRVEGLYSLDEISFSGFSQAASDLLLKILNRKPDLRIKIPEIKAHRFFEGIDWEKISNLEQDMPIIPDLSTKEESKFSSFMINEDLEELKIDGCSYGNIKWNFQLINIE